jgi:hypothetical protein
MYVQRVEENSISKGILYMNLESTRKTRNRWKDVVRENGRKNGWWRRVAG